ncbi:MAG: Gp37-like protein [[Eubacterium] siraeum]
MIVRVYDFLSAEKPKFSQNLVGIVSDVESFKYTRRAYDIGSFEMTIPTHADEAGCIQPDRMLIVGEKLGQTYIASDPTKRIVRGMFLYVTDIEKKDDKITVTGYDLKYLFALRVTLFPKEEQDKGTYGYYVTSGTTFSCISDIINYNIVNATDSDRQIYGMFGITMPVNQINADPPLTGIQNDRYMTRLEPVSTAIFNLLKNCKTHFYDMRLIIDDNAEDGDSYNPHMESSEDKPTIIIDESRYNIKSYTRKDGTSAYKNAIYAVVGSGDDVTVKCVKRPDDTASGVKRKEVVLDVDTDSVAEIDRYALKAAEEYVISDDFEIEPLFMDDEAEPELAQKVSIRIDGVEYETVITEITDEYANGKHTQSYVCGDKKLKVLNVLNKATAGNTQKIVNNKIAAGNAGGVGKFTNTDRNCEIFNDYKNNVASAYYSHAEGYKTTANAPYSHAEGSNTVASNPSCHAEGTGCVASGQSSHAEGENCRATGSYSHAEGHNTVASGTSSHASGWGTVAGYETFAIGRWNKTAGGLFVVGNGWNSSSDENKAYRSDAMVLDISGNLHIAGKLTADGGVGYVLPSATADTLGGVRIGDNINVSDSGTISVNLSAYLKSDEISDWAKAESKPVYTAEEVGAATVSELDSKDYLKASDLTGQTVDLNTLMLNTADDKGKSKRYFCTSASAQYITNRPVSANEPFELTVDNIRYVNADAFNSVQRYTSATRKRSYTRWCDDNVWRAWMCDTDIVIYGTVTSEFPKSFDYATYGEGYNQVEIEPYYDNNASPIRNRIVLTLTSATFYDRDVLTIGDSVEHLKIENGTVTMSLTGTKTLSFMIKYTNKRA